MITVVIPLYNKEKSIGRCIDSILEQSFTDWECIIVDDGSTDNSPNVVGTYVDNRIKIIKKSNSGVSSARNIGVKNASGEWIVFIDADDFLTKDALKEFLTCHEANRTNCIASNFYISDGTNMKIALNACAGVIDNPFKEWYFHRFCPRTGALMIKKETIEKYPFPENLTRYEDAAVLFDLMRNEKFAQTDYPTMVYTKDDNYLSKVCKDHTKDFIFNMIFENKSLWEKMLLCRLLRIGYKSYSNKRFLLYSLYKKQLPAILFCVVISFIIRLKIIK